MKELIDVDEDLCNLIIYIKEITGDVLTTVISLETVMNQFLAKHFCGHSEEKLTESIEMIFSTTKITFDNKRDIMLAIMLKHHGSKKYAQQLNKSLQKIIEHRNIFAHHQFDSSPKAIALFRNNKTIQFLKYKNAEIPEPYTTEDISALTFDITAAMLKIIALTH